MKFRFCTALLLLTPFAATAQELAVTPAKESPIYKLGEPVIWNLQVSGEGADGIKEVRYSVKKDAGLVISSGVLPLQNGAAKLESKLDVPGTLLAEFAFDKADGKAVQTLAGAAIEPFKIEPSVSEPGDFGAFWKSKIEELDKVPQNPVLTSQPSEAEGVDYWKISLDNIRGTHIQGQIARPTVGEKFPALLRVQYAGVYGLPKGNVTGYAKGGWLTLNINAHDLPIDETKEFYAAQAQGALKNYTAIGDNDREKSYFLRMFLGCYRAVEYLKTRPDWDGKTIVVEGASQGGLQGLVTGGLNPSVTAVIVNVPAGADVTGPLIGRAIGWPYVWYHAKKDPAVQETSRYFDALNFARHIKVPTLVAVGLLDTTSPAANVIAAFNQISGSPKRLVIMPRSDHQGRGGFQADYYKYNAAWMKSISKGQPLPAATE